MRIVSGLYKGRRFQAPVSLPVRPTTDLAKESLFNILQSKTDLDNINVLDLFSGIGSISFEFSSRGAASVICVDIHKACIDFVRKQALQWNISNITAIQQDVFKFLQNSGSRYSFDIVFADPPYDSDKIESIPQLIFSSGILNKDALVIIEHGKTHDFSVHPFFLEERRYGKVHFSFFKLK